MSGTFAQNHVDSNLAFTRFLFVRPLRQDETAKARVRAAGGLIARGFFNDFDTDAARDAQPHESIHFLTATCAAEPEDGIAGARWVAQVTARYRPRLLEVEQELRRRVAGDAEISSLEGALRVPRYTSAEMHNFAYKSAAPRASGRVVKNAIVVPIRKSAEWWAMSTLDRHAYFYPRPGCAGGPGPQGHARCAEAGISTIFRRLYHNPDGYQRAGEFDFIAYFECADEHLQTFEEIRNALRNLSQNPEWGYVEEGPEWRGTRVMKW